MTTRTRNARSTSRTSRISKGSRAMRRTVGKSFVSLGELISAAYEVTGSAQATARLLSSSSPLANMLGRRIVVAT